MRTKYNTEIHLQNGRIRSSKIIGAGEATPEELKLSETLKGVMNIWIRSKAEENPALDNSKLLVKTKVSLSAASMGVEFKVLAVEPIDG